MIRAIKRTRTITSLLLLLAIAISLAWNIFHFSQHEHNAIQESNRHIQSDNKLGVQQPPSQEALQFSYWPLILSHLLGATTGLIIITVFANRLSRERHKLEESHERLKEEIEERKKKEGELQTIKEELENRVRDRTSELQQINTILNESLQVQQKTEQSLSQTASHLRQRNQELNDFTHAISHDLKEPLILIQAFCDRLHKHCRERLDNQGHNYLERIEKSTRRMQNLIDGLLLYSRIDQRPQSFEPLPLNSVIQLALDDLAVKIEENQARITIEELGSIEADPLQMRQLFQNIIGNSIKYRNPEQQPLIQIRLRPFSQEEENRHHLRLSIQDNGIGFEAKYTEKIFDIFQRLHGQEEINGSGIGLSICKKILDRHHGAITANSHPGQGTEFIIILPRKQTDEARTLPSS